ncbi:MAG: transposase, partial [Planctomycetota bacterium]
LLPVPYYMVTFTVPGKLRMVVRCKQRACYAALFDCGARTITELAAGKRFVGTEQIGFFGALHTWGRDFTVYNPHVHFVVPGGGISDDGSKWLAAAENFLIPVHAASKLYAGKFRSAMREAGLEQAFIEADGDAWNSPWNVDVRHVGNGEAVLKYLAPYVNRVAISNRRIESVDDSGVTYRFTPSGKEQSVARTVDGNEFVRGFLQHTLPPRFQRIRYYGWQSPNCKLKFQYVQMLVWFYLGWCWQMKKAEVIDITKPPRPCPKCQVGTMHAVMITDSEGRVIWRHPLMEHAIAFLDST